MTGEQSNYSVAYLGALLLFSTLRTLYRCSDVHLNSTILFLNVQFSRFPLFLPVSAYNNLYNYIICYLETGELLKHQNFNVGDLFLPQTLVFPPGLLKSC